MNVSAWVGTLILIAGITATPAAAQTVSVGTLRGAVPADASVGAAAPGGAPAGPLLTGTEMAVSPWTVPPGAATGALAGPLPRGATTRALPDSASTIGPFGGAFVAPVPPTATFRTPTSEDVARTQESLARMHLTDGSDRDAESRLHRSIELREEALGPQSADVAEAMESHAQLLRRYNRTEAAAEFEERAQAIREKRAGPPPVP